MFQLHIIPVSHCLGNTSPTNSEQSSRKNIYQSPSNSEKSAASCWTEFDDTIKFSFRARLSRFLTFSGFTPHDHSTALPFSDWFLWYYFSQIECVVLLPDFCDDTSANATPPFRFVNYRDFLRPKPLPTQDSRDPHIFRHSLRAHPRFSLPSSPFPYYTQLG